MTYLEYDEYISLGGVCDITVFNRNIHRACSVIDSYTYDRINKNMKEIPMKVKLLCRDLVEYYATNASVTEKTVTSRSESAGAVSESVSYASKDSDEIKKEVQDLIFTYLWTMTDDNGTLVLYKGASS